MRKAYAALLFLMLLPAVGFTQNVPNQRSVPDCFIPFRQTTAGRFYPFDNRPALSSADKGCRDWVFVYSATGFASLSVQVEAAIDNNNAAGTYEAWVTAGGSMLSGAFPITDTERGSATMTGFFPFVAIDVLSVSGTGSITGALYGFRTNPGVGSGGGGGGGGSVTQGTIPWDVGGTITVVQTTATNLNAAVVGGKTNNAAAPSTNNIGALTAVATAAMPSYTEGYLGALSMNLKGYARVMNCDSALNDQCAKVDANGNLNVITPGITINTTLPTYTNQQIGDLQLTTRGELIVGGGAAHDAADIANPLLMGMHGVDFGSTPTAVTAGDRSYWVSTRAGVPFVIGGHPNIVTLRAPYTSAQTNTAIVSVSGGTKIIVTKAYFSCGAGVSSTPSVLIGLGATTTPTTTGVVLAHDGLLASSGSGVNEGSGDSVIGIGGDGEDLLITTGTISGGTCSAVVKYFTIAG